MARSASFRLIAAIRRFIEQRHPDVCCDTCLALHMGVNLADARAIAFKLADEPGFRRRHALCGTCFRTRPLTCITVRVRVTLRISSNMNQDAG